MSSERVVLTGGLAQKNDVLMQMLAECYDVMRRRLGMTNAEMAAEFARIAAGDGVVVR